MLIRQNPQERKHEIFISKLYEWEGVSSKSYTTTDPGTKERPLGPKVYSTVQMEHFK